jgi:hypothetical protein
MKLHTFTHEQSSILLLADDIHYDNTDEQQLLVNNFREETQLTDKTEAELCEVAEKLWQVLEANNAPLYEDSGVKCDDTCLSQLREVVATF